MPTEHHPLSPPDTESISSHLDHYATPHRRPSQALTESTFALPTIPGTPDILRESAGARFRRLAGIPATQSGSREFRGASRPQTRWLIVLLPPAHLAAELAVGHRSPGRLADGLLIPLFPTLFAQLTAIAKEFNLPSTTGLCLYLHLPDAPATPRITDDTWPLLWSRHLHTDDSALPLGLPVAGHVEFDIDVPNARWYPMWFAHVSRQELVPDLARAVPVSPRALGKDDNATRASKSVPRPLALAPRNDTVPQFQVDSGPSPVPSPSRPSIPKSASKETVDKVRRWSALVTPEPALRSLPASTEPVSVEEISAPLSTDETSALLLTEETPDDEPLNLEDFQWSITSAGPPSPTSSCATSASSRAPSIHLLERNEGSVLLTPTTATSWGPPSVSDVESDLNLNLGWRVRSPDLGERAEGSVLLTPSTATSWGAPLSYPPTPAQWIAMQEFVRSPDLGERAEGSVLLTPSTATTWGAPLSYPPTPAQWHEMQRYIRSPDMGERAEGSVLLTPSTATSWGAPLTYPPTPAQWYAMQQYVRSPDAGQRAEGSVLLTPSTATTWGAPLSYPPTPEMWEEAQRRWVASPDMGARAEVEGEFGRARMSTVTWGAEVETEEEAYARMGLTWRWEFGWPMEERGPETSGVDAGERSLGEDETSLYGEEGALEVHVTREEEAQELDLEPFEFEIDTSDAILEVEDISALDEGHSTVLGALAAGEGSEGELGAFEYELPRFELLSMDEDEDESAGTDADAATSDIFEYELPDFELAPSEGENAGMDAGIAPMSDGYSPRFGPAEDESEDEDAAVDAAAVNVFEYGFPHFESPASGENAVHLDTPEPPSFTTATSRELGKVKKAAPITPANVQTRSYGAYPYLNLYPAAYPYLELYPAAPGATTQMVRPTFNLVTRSSEKELVDSTAALVHSHAASLVESAPSPVESAPSPVESTTSPVESASSPAESTPSPVESINSTPSQADSRISSPPSRKPSLSVHVPRARSGTMVAVNPDDVRSRAWSRALPPVPPVPREASVRKESMESVRSVPAVPRRLQQLGRKPSVVFDNTEFELLPSEKKHASSSTYPHPYPHNLAQLYPAAGSLAYPRNLESLYPSVVKATPALRPAPVPAVFSALKTKPEPKRLNNSLAICPTGRKGAYPVFDLYPAVYPHNLLEIYPSTVRPVAPPAPSAPATAPTTRNTPKEESRATSFVQNKALGGIQVRLAPRYPALDLFPAVYPYNLQHIYLAPALFSATPTVTLASDVQDTRASTVQLSQPKPELRRLDNPLTSCLVGRKRPYPVFDLYPAVYPHNLLEIYHSAARLMAPSAPTTRGTSKEHAAALVQPKEERKATLPVRTKAVGGIQVRLAPRYPVLELFPAVYPHNLQHIYLVTALLSVAPITTPVNDVQKTQVPTLEPTHPVPRPLVGAEVRLARTYPNIEIYAPVYPFNLAIYPLSGVKDKVVPLKSEVFRLEDMVATSESADLGDAAPVDAISDFVIGKEEVQITSQRKKTHAQLCIEAWRKAHAQLVAEVVAEVTSMRAHKSHNELQGEVFPDGLPTPPLVPAAAVASPQVTVTPVQGNELEPKSSVAPLRRQRSGTIMRRAPSSEDLTPPPPLPQNADLGRSRSMLEARTQMFERTTPPARAQTIGAPRPGWQKNASFERAKSLFHAPEETNKAASEGSRTPPRVPVRRVSKLDMSKFGFS